MSLLKPLIITNHTFLLLLYTPMFIVSLIITLGMFLFNGLASWLPLNNMSTGQLSDNLHTLITPAGFTFGIWSLIYAGLIIMFITIGTQKIILPQKTRNRYVISCFANISWIIARHRGNLHLSMILMLILLISLIMIYQSIKKSTLSQRIIQSTLLYLGWIQIASFVMLTIYLIYQLGWIDKLNTIRPIIVITLVGVLNIGWILKERQVIPPLVGIRALWGIINGQTTSLIVTSSWIVLTVLVIGVLGYGVGTIGRSKS
ncbi:MAG TPA: tryptophan-rich sensory protein [Candidatus Absconditabacterales bacterium]|nr:tryptophan-rich sensory protein [Candidatus Absconditabacterales bacterium]